MRFDYGDGWPDAVQNTLLRACLSTGDEALEAWREWKSQIAVHQLDPESIRLLPFLYANLAEYHTNDPDIAVYRGHHRTNWFRNQLLLREVERTSIMLQEAAIPVMLLKGSALILTVYQNRGLRTMNDADICVPPSLVHKTVDIISADWSPISYMPTPQTMKYKHSLGFRRKDQRDGFEFDLHWHVLEECVGENDDRDFWEASQTVALSDHTQVRVLCPADQLLHICVHGIRADEELQRFRWCVDASQILQQSRVDWDRLIEQTRHRELVLPVRIALHYLCDNLKQPVPVDVLQQLDAHPVAPQYVREYRVKASRYTYLNRLKVHWFHFRRSRPTVRGVWAILRFVGYLRDRWGLNTPVDIYRLLDKRWNARFAQVRKCLRI